MKTTDIAEFILGVKFSNLPPKVVNLAREALSDNLGVILAAHHDQAVEAVRRVAMQMGGREESTLIGTGVKVPCNIAAMVNAIMGSTLDMDDGAVGPVGGRGHPSGMMVPSTLAVAEKQKSTGKELLEALVVGYEVAIRTAWMMRTSEQPIPSRFCTMAGVAGTYGVAAATAKLLKLNKKETTQALCIAGTHCPLSITGIGPIPSAPGMTKENMGWAAMTGVTATLLAKSGFTGSISIYDLPEYSDEAWRTLGSEWEIFCIYFKPYSACRSAHASLDGVFELIRQNKLNPNDILRITVGLTPFQMRLCNDKPATKWEAEYSIPFLIGAALVDGEVGPEQITENRLKEEAIFSQASKVKLNVDPEVVASLHPMRWGAKVELETKDGRKFKTFVRALRGSQENPLAEEELKAKFMKLSTKAMGAVRSEDLIRCLDRIVELQDVTKLVEKISHLD